MKCFILLLVLLKIIMGKDLYKNTFKVENKNTLFKRIRRSDMNMVPQELVGEKTSSIAEEIEQVRIDLKQAELNHVVIKDIHGRPINISKFMKPIYSRNQPVNINEIENNLKRISFFLYTKHNNLRSQILRTGDKDSLENSNFKQIFPTKIIIHAYQNQGNSAVCLKLRDAYLENNDYNIVIVDWGEIAKSNNYLLVVVYAKRIGRIVGEFINFLENNGVEPANIHIIGYDVGAHIAGFSQQGVKRKVARITGLDPARYGFRWRVVGRLTKSDANFVDIIHTNANILGLEKALAHADFYPNGGTIQPGCGSFGYICSHFRAVELYAESVSTTFKAAECTNSATTTIMGDGTPPTARGMFCLNTNEDAPFASRRSLDNFQQPHFLTNFASCSLSNMFSWLLSVYFILRIFVSDTLF
ncbi:hypothetical protein ILUMI_03508 [Ignelater luminosus]|uniref:Lipase domain-containing protein n=1 Tax=Ignelater luminosus TaxID=2038154 RepID=A0A8K0DBF2_IGNLU|nr:hypothetical protein ILUMI_03508 [Ignelater luminosus]